ncbi:MAG: hypothetical protein IKP66_04565 [Lachnospiraceae bacterium]|nr:hypothetical protein [Lachnospiraceae bacterium]
MVTPKDLENKIVNEYDTDLLEETIDAKLMEDYKNHGYHKVLIDDEVPIEVSRKIIDMYISHGWNYGYIGIEPTESGKTLYILSLKEEPKFENSKYEKKSHGFKW